MAEDKSKDRVLGMDRPITRRDFLNGIAIGTAALASGPLFADSPAATSAAASAPAAAQDAAGYYPPLLTGMRGSHPGSFEAAHALRDGRPSPPPVDTGEEYDLIVVGGGISGLAAAHFYRARTSPGSRILILENHDDFGGHAKRNEFNLNGHLNLLNGGTLEIDSPRPYGPVAAGLLQTLGLDVANLIKTTQHLKFYDQLGLQAGAFFDRETFGSDKLVIGIGTPTLAQALASAPLSEQARKEIVQIETARIDYLPGLSSDEKKQRLSRISYEAFLRDVVRVDPAVLKFYHARTMGEWGVGTDAVSALDCWGINMPGFQGMKLAKGAIARMGYTPAGYADTGGSLRLHFPDGNATIARLLVRNLIPQAYGGLAAPQQAAEQVVTARVNYAQLDVGGTPLVYSSVALRNWQAFAKLKVHRVYAPGSYHTYLHLNPYVTIGAYRSTKSPDEPVLVHMVRTPCKAGLSEHDQNRAGREELLATSFDTFERNIRDQLGRTLEGGGFDPARDITAITVNRWPHGYAPEYNPLFDPELPEAEQPHVVGRAPFGRITVANSDAGGAAYTDSAINQGHRAVMELLKPAA